MSIKHFKNKRAFFFLTLYKRYILTHDWAKNHIWFHTDYGSYAQVLENFYPTLGIYGFMLLTLIFYINMKKKTLAI